MAICSSHREITIDRKTVMVGEVGLGGEIRPVTHVDRRIQEAAKLGFTRVIFPEYNRKGLEIDAEIELVGVSDVHDCLSTLVE